MNEFLSFRKMITPLIIQIVFWVGVAAYAIWAIGILIYATSVDGVLGFFLGLIGALIAFAIGVLLVRIWCELIILLFRIYDELRAIRTGQPPEGQGFPVSPITGAASRGFSAADGVRKFEAPTVVDRKTKRSSRTIARGHNGNSLSLYLGRGQGRGCIFVLRGAEEPSPQPSPLSTRERERSHAVSLNDFASGPSILDSRSPPPYPLLHVRIGWCRYVGSETSDRSRHARADERVPRPPRAGRQRAVHQSRSAHHQPAPAMRAGASAAGDHRSGRSRGFSRFMTARSGSCSFSTGKSTTTKPCAPKSPRRCRAIAGGRSPDTEALLASYLAFGERCVEKLEGMFAFAVWDESADTLFLARDRMGQKPLYYAAVGAGGRAWEHERPPMVVAFASELSALRQAGGWIHRSTARR